MTKHSDIHSYAKTKQGKLLGYYSRKNNPCNTNSHLNNAIRSKFLEVYEQIEKKVAFVYYKNASETKLRAIQRQAESTLNI